MSINMYKVIQCGLLTWNWKPWSSVPQSSALVRNAKDEFYLPSIALKGWFNKAYYCVKREKKKKRPLLNHVIGSFSTIVGQSGEADDRQFIILLKLRLHGLVIYRAQKGIQ